MFFDAIDDEGVPIYHANVLMCVATSFAMIGVGMITHPGRRSEIVTHLRQYGREIVPLTNAQMTRFAGNPLEPQGAEGRVLALSTTAVAALDDEQRRYRDKRPAYRPRHSHD